MPWAGIVIVCAGVLPAPLDTSVNVAFPVITEAFALPLREIQWVVIAFVLAVAVCFLFAVASYPLVTDFLSKTVPTLAEVARRLSVTERFQGFTRGVVSLRDLIYFASFIGFWLYLNAVIVEHRKAD